jgi:hypothetical protein
MRALTAATALLAAVASGPVIRFTNVARQAGLTALNVNGGDRAKKYLLETTGSGVAFLDYDRDGHLDVFLVNGSRLEGSGAHNVLYRNRGDGTFEDVTGPAGMARSGWGQGVCAGDYDNDGFVDLFVTYWGTNVLYRNQAGRRFAEVTARAGLRNPAPRWGAGCAFLDYDRDGDLDLFVANYLVQDVKTAPAPGENPYCWYRGIAVACGPRGLPFDTNQLYRNDGGVFTEVSGPSGVAAVKGRYSLGVLVSDFDNDGWPDIYVACDQTPSILYRNNRNATFTDVALLQGVALGEDGKAMSGMGAAAADFDGNGWLDIFRTNFSDEIETLYRNRGEGQFDDLTRQAGLGHNTRFVGWGCGFPDVDNDGRPDLFLANGHVFPEVDRLGLDIRYRDRKILYRNLGGGKFEDASERAGPGILEPHSSRGVAFGDYNRDGRIDIVINNQNDPPALLRNDTSAAGHWLVLELVGTRSNRSGIGARVRLRAGGREQLDEVRSGGSYLSQNDLALHFGLGDSDTAEWIEIRWPSGQVDRLEGLRADRRVVVREGRRDRP